MSEFSRETLLNIIETDHVQCGEASALARIALAAMDSEPVAYISKSDFDAGYPHILARRDFNKACTLPVYAAQPAPEYPEVLPCPVLLEPGMRFGKGVKTRLVLDAIQRRAEQYAELEAMTQEERAEYDANIEAFKAMLPQPVPVAYSDFESFWSSYIHPLAQDDELKDFAWDIWNACRAAILAAAKHDTTALNSVQSVVTVPGKLIPVSEQKPDCWCLTCRPVVLNDMRFVVCPDCGNKRCPRANDHRNACTGSNEPGQEGSAHPAAPQSPGNEPATVPGKWIPVSERMPEDEQEVLTINRMGHRFVSFFDKHSGLYFDRLDAPAACCIEHVLVTHWMPLPAAPQEVNHG